MTDVIMCDGASNIQICGELLKIHLPEISVMRGFKNTVYLSFNEVSKIRVLNHIITDNNAI